MDGCTVNDTGTVTEAADTATKLDCASTTVSGIGRLKVDRNTVVSCVRTVVAERLAVAFAVKLNPTDELVNPEVLE